MKPEKNEEASEPYIRSLGENAEAVRKCLNDKRVQDAFIAAIDEDPQLVEVLAKVTPNVASLPGDWSCCRGDRPVHE